MNARVLVASAVILAAVAAIGFTGGAQPPDDASKKSGVAPDAERAAIAQSANAFSLAFNKANAQAVAAMWTANGESRDADGRTLTGRDAIEKAYADFFKANAGATIEVLVKSVRFPATDLAVEEGVLRLSRGPKSLPVTSAYVAVHVREAGQWKIALSSESAPGVGRLEDLDWFLGEWTLPGKGGDMAMSVTRDPTRPVINVLVKRKVPGRPNNTTTIRIAADPETGGLRSWSFEDDGAHSQALWRHDGKAWLLECRGVLADGTPTSETIVLQRTGVDAITWRAIDRVLGDEPLPDTAPVKLSRSK